MHSLGARCASGFRVCVGRGALFALVGTAVGFSATRSLAQCSQRQKLTASDGATGDRFGRSVSVSGNTAFVGGKFGSVGVYRFNGISWTEEQMLPSRARRFGWSVSVSGDTAFVGAYEDNRPGCSNCGAVYVFRFNGTSWVERQKLVASDASTNDWFGRTVSVNGDNAVVGALSQGCGGADHCGAVYVYSRVGSSWVEQQKLTVSNAGVYEGFGDAVSLDGRVAVVGAFGDDCAVGVDCGSAHVFRFNGTSWIHEQKLLASDPAQFSSLGFSASVSGKTIFLGAPSDRGVFGGSAGSTYVFRFDGASWTETQKLTASDPNFLAQFGTSVSVSGADAIIGARQGSAPAGPFSGAAYMFRFTAVNWVEQQKLTAEAVDGTNFFGQSVALSGGTAVVGAFIDSCASGIQCGAAYAFACPPTGSLPTASAWGLLSLTLLLLVVGKIVFRTASTAPAPARR